MFFQNKSFKIFTMVSVCTNLTVPMRMSVKEKICYRRITYIVCVGKLIVLSTIPVDMLLNIHKCVWGVTVIIEGSKLGYPSSNDECGFPQFTWKGINPIYKPLRLWGNIRENGLGEGKPVAALMWLGIFRHFLYKILGMSSIPMTINRSENN